MSSRAESARLPICSSDKESVMSDINEMNVGPRWYVAHTYSGYENKVKASLEKVIENRGLEHLIYDIRIPVETTVEKGSDGKEDKIVETKIFPGYVLVKMTMTDESWHAVRNISGVTGFVGPGSRPTPLSEEDVEALNIEERKVKAAFSVGDNVTITDGLFSGYSGTVQSVSDDLKTVTVLVKRGRRDMPVELDSAMIRRDN